MGCVPLTDVLYGAYERRLAKQIRPEDVPRHVGVMLDGNRRWARENGFETVDGHQAGADKIKHLLGWCEEAGVEVVTLWLLSTDNLGRSREGARPAPEDHRDGGRRPRHRGTLAAAPDRGARPAARRRPRSRSRRPRRRPGAIDGLHVNVAVGYGGRREIADAVRSLLLEHAAQGTPVEQIAESIAVEDIAEHLYTKGQPDPDLVIRTSGEQRLGGFLLWQSAKSEFYFCEAYWPDFRHVDFLRALRSYANRERRFGR